MLCGMSQGLLRACLTRDMPTVGILLQNVHARPSVWSAQVMLDRLAALELQTLELRAQVRSQADNPPALYRADSPLVLPAGGVNCSLG